MSSGTVGRWVAGGLAAAGLLAAGVALGSMVERAVVGSRVRRGPHAEGDLGLLGGRVLDVRTSDGVRLHVEVDDPDGDAEPGADDVTVVFCHGYALSQHEFHYQRLALRSHARLVFWDQRSHGRSAQAAAETHHIDQLGQDLAAVLAAAAPTGPVVLVGHSMGGMTVMALAAQHPDLFGSRVLGTALVATSAGGLSSVPLGLPAPVGTSLQRRGPGVLAAVARNPALADLVQDRGSDLGLLITQAYSFGSPVPPEVLRFTARMISSTSLDVVATFLPTFSRHDKTAALAALQRTDVVVLVGARDVLTPVAHSRAIVAEVPAARLVVLPDTGHMITLERPAEVNAELRSLVQRVRAEARSRPESGATPS